MIDNFLPLLALAQGRKVRAWRAPVWRPRESKLHVLVADVLRKHCLPDWRWTFLNRKAKDPREGAIFKTMGLQRAWPDFQLLSPRCMFHGLEIKREGEDLREDQEEFRAWVLSHGGEYEVASTIDRVLDIFRYWKCLRIYSAPRPRSEASGFGARP